MFLAQPTRRTHAAASSIAANIANPGAAASPLILCDRLLSLAQDADRAGYSTTAERLVDLAQRVFDEKRIA